MDFFLAGQDKAVNSRNFRTVLLRNPEGTQEELHNNVVPFPLRSFSTDRQRMLPTRAGGDTGSLT
jgi:hypothetical protein